MSCKSSPTKYASMTHTGVKAPKNKGDSIKMKREFSGPVKNKVNVNRSFENKQHDY